MFLDALEFFLSRQNFQFFSNYSIVSHERIINEKTDMCVHILVFFLLDTSVYSFFTLALRPQSLGEYFTRSFDFFFRFLKKYPHKSGILVSIIGTDLKSSPA